MVNIPWYTQLRYKGNHEEKTTLNETKYHSGPGNKPSWKWIEQNYNKTNWKWIEQNYNKPNWKWIEQIITNQTENE